MVGVAGEQMPPAYEVGYLSSLLLQSLSFFFLFLLRVSLNLSLV